MMLSSKLQWACRRGMLELDLILQNFLSSAYPSLDQQFQRDFEALLHCTDAELADWLLTSQTPPEKFYPIITRIKDHAVGNISA